jgi:polysaccharide export outer membrane protein
MTFSFQSLRLGLVTLLMLGALHAYAQFNGPGLLPADDLNRPQVPTTDRALLYPPTHDLLLGPQDLITIHVFDEEEYSPTVRIGNDGSVLLPFIGTVHLAGMSITDAEKLIQTRLQTAGLYNDPQVTIQVTEGPNAVVTLVGEAHSVIPISGSRRLYDVLAAGGGFPVTATHVITINRPGVDQPIIVDLGSDPARSALADIPVFAGDTIVVSRAGVVYIVGAFKTSGIIPLNQNTPLTLLEATALSGGTAFEARYNDLRIIRTIGTQRTVVKLDIKDVLFGKVADPILFPNDIVFLPNSFLKYALANGTLGTVLGAAGLVVGIALR